MSTTMAMTSAMIAMVRVFMGTSRGRRARAARGLSHPSTLPGPVFLLTRAAAVG
jgi:hypothetical protein